MLNGKPHYIRLCDNYWEWDVLSGNSDALCHEDSRDFNCSTCENNIDCKYSNWPYQSDDELMEYGQLVTYRDSKRNTEVCNYCVYNKEEGWAYLGDREASKVKLLKLKRNENR